MRYNQEVKKIICLNTSTSLEELREDAYLEDIGIDSLSFIKIIIKIEDKYGFEFPEEKLSIKEVKTVRGLCNIVTSYNK